MGWPLSQDYNEVIQSPGDCFADLDLRSGAPLCNALGLPLPCSGNFADVYPILSPPRKWAVKCFTREVRGLRERYTKISEYLAQLNLPFLIECRFLDQGILVRGQWYPVVKMQWIEGQTLNDFVREQAGSPPLLQTLAAIWRKMDSRLREGRLAHGDLQHGNVLLVRGKQAGSLAVRLVDYDGMCVPALEQMKSAEVGHPNYQHPQRLREGAYGPLMDRFADLAIYTALRAMVAGGRRLWQRFDNGDNLLFTQADFEEPAKSELFQELARSPEADVRKLAGALQEAARGPVEAVPTLDAVVGPRPGTGVQPAPAGSVTTSPTVAPPPVAAPEADSVPDWGLADVGEPDTRPKRRRQRARQRSPWPIVFGVGGVLLGVVVGTWIAVTLMSTPTSKSVASRPAGPAPHKPTPTEKTSPDASLAVWDKLQVAVLPLDSGAGSPGRSPVPSRTGQESAFREVKVRYALEVARGGPEALQPVARKALMKARSSQPGGELRFGALVVSRDLAALVGDVPLALLSAELLAEEYAVDDWRVRAQALQSAARRSELQQVVAESAVAIAESALSADSFDAASDLLAIATTAAGNTKDARLGIQIMERAVQCRQQKQALQKVKPALAELADHPRSSAANREAGTWYGCWKGDWDRALPLLAQADGAWKAAAVADLAQPTTAAEKKAVGDRWWDLAEEEAGHVQAGLRAHAADWYQDALAGLPEVVKGDVEARLAELAEETAHVDLLQLIDVNRAPSVGLWTRDNKGLLSPSPPFTDQSLIEAPYVPPPEYRLTLQAERIDGPDALLVGTVVQERQSRVLLDGWPKPPNLGRSGLEWIDNRRAPDNETRRDGLLLARDQLTEVVVTVRKGEVQVLVNGKELFTFKGDPARLSLPIGRFPAHPAALWLGTWEGVFRVRKWEVLPLSGRGRRLPYPPRLQPVKNGTYVSDLPRKGGSVGANTDIGVNGELGYLGAAWDSRIKVNWRHYTKGISTHGRSKENSYVAYQLDGKFKKLSGAVAVSDSAFVLERPGPASPLVFSVWTDGTEAWKSRGLQKWKETDSFDIDVTGVQRLELRVNCPNESWAHSVWLDPVLER
jgi:hypothetical protein